MLRTFQQKRTYTHLLFLPLGLLPASLSIEPQLAWLCLFLHFLQDQLLLRKNSRGEGKQEAPEADDPRAKERKQFLMTLELLPIGVIIAETDAATTVYRNKKMREIWTPAATEKGQSSWEVYTKAGTLMEKDAWPIVRTIRKGENVSNEEIYVRHADGREEIFLVSSAPVYDAVGRIIAGIGLCQDVSEQKRVEREAAELRIREQGAQAASQLKSRFLAHMSHEFRTPLNGVLGMASLLQQSLRDREQIDLCTAILESSENLQSLINDVLDFSKVTNDELDFSLADFELAPMVQETCSLHQKKMQQKGLRLVSIVSPDLPETMHGDRHRLQQVLGHLLSNACKFTEKGQIQLRISIQSQNETSVRLLFEVEDSGVGISKDTFPGLFSAFTQADDSPTRQFGGAGLGLSLCRHLVRRMGGDIDVRSQAGQGSCFWFTVNFERAHGRSSRTENKEGVPSHILIAEDVEINQIITKRMLQNLGYAVSIVANGREALQALEESSFDLVLMDCQMPEMDGYAATAAIRSSFSDERSSIPIIAMTANSMRGDRERCLAVGMNDYISKPVHPEQLDELLSKWLHINKSRTSA